MRIVFALLIALIGCRPGADQAGAADNLQRHLDLLKNGTLCQKRAAVLALYEQGKKAIPALVDRIEDSEIAYQSTNVLASPVISSAPPDSQHDQFAGVLYAYVIELILARDNVSRDETGSCKFLLGLDDYVYGHGLILNGNELIKANDLSRIKQIYLRWWTGNRGKNLTEMRQEWQRLHRPLAGTEYRWY